MSYVALATITLSSTSSSITFTSIPSNYKDLVLVTNSTTANGGLLYLRLNGDSGNNYNTVVMRGLSDGAQSFAYANEPGYVSVSGYTNNSNAVINIMDYSATDKHKSILSRSGYSNQTTVEATAIRWANTAAVNSVSLVFSSGGFGAGATASLYGVAA
jgi:hypothetical protein